MGREYHVKTRKRGEKNKMIRVAQFKKISYEQYLSDYMDIFTDLDYSIPANLDMINESWSNIKLPVRATKYSAGYDFCTPIDFELNPGEEIKIPTGIRCQMNDDFVLTIYPRSSIGFKYNVCLANTVGVIDADYYYSSNEGHIMAKFVNRGDKTFVAHAGDKIMQGIFLPYGITNEDNTTQKRNGGFGSTGN